MGDTIQPHGLIIILKKELSTVNGPEGKEALMPIFWVMMVSMKSRAELTDDAVRCDAVKRMNPNQIIIYCDVRLSLPPSRSSSSHSRY